MSRTKNLRLNLFFRKKCFFSNRRIQGDVTFYFISPFFLFFSSCYANLLLWRDFSLRFRLIIINPFAGVELNTVLEAVVCVPLIKKYRSSGNRVPREIFRTKGLSVHALRIVINARRAKRSRNADGGQIRLVPRRVKDPRFYFYVSSCYAISIVSATWIAI